MIVNEAKTEDKFKKVNEAKTEDKFKKLDSKVDKFYREMRQLKDTFKRNQGTTPESQSFGSSYLNNSEFPLPVFDENSDNTVFHLRQLDNYMNLRDIPAAGRLTVAYRSLNGVLSRQWAETVSNQLSDYEAYEKEFLSTSSSTAQQSLVKCTSYQGRYARQSILSLSAHFLKYSTVASYLDPRSSNIEIIETIRYHFPISVQRAMVSMQLNSIGEA
jgi:hypothetical protein